MFSNRYLLSFALFSHKARNMEQPVRVNLTKNNLLIQLCPLRRFAEIKLDDEKKRVFLSF